MTNPATYIRDRLTDLVTALGTAKQKGAGATWAMSTLTADQIVAAYETDWIARKMVDIRAFDMARAGRNWQATKDQITAVEAEERRLNLRWQRFDAMRQGRLFGGAAIVLGLDPRLGQPNTELDLTAVGKGDLLYTRVLNRYELNAGEVIRDPGSPYFGQPQTYSVTWGNGQPLEIHPSRVVRFIGDAKPSLGAAPDPWGNSVLVALEEAIKNAGLSASGIASLILEAKVDVFKIKNFTQNVGGAEYRKKMVDRFTLMNTAKSLVNSVLADADEEWEQKQISFAQLPELLREYMGLAAAAGDYPLTRFLGQSPGGLNATGESDTRNYYDRVSAEQELKLRPQDEKIDEVVLRSALGTRPAEVFFTYAPLWQLGEKERAEVRKADAETAKAYVTSGLVPLPAMAKGVQNKLIEEGGYPGLELSLAGENNAVGLPIDLFNAMIKARQSGDAVRESLFLLQSQAGLLPEGMTFEKFEATTEEETPDVPEGDELSPDDLGGDRGQPGAGQQPQRRAANDSSPRSLYVQRKLLNADEVIAWAKGQGLKTTLEASDLHVTVLFSRAAVDWMALGENWSGDGEGNITIQPGGPRLLELLGDKALVLAFSSTELQWRHRNMIEAGASHDWPEYQPHVTLTYDVEGLDVAALEPYRGKLVFGPELFEELDLDWAEKVVEA